MAIRPVQLTDLATLLYIERSLDARERKLPWLAEHTGIPYRTLHKWLTERRSISIADLRSILRAFEVDPGEAIKEIDLIELELQDSAED